MLDNSSDEDEHNIADDDLDIYNSKHYGGFDTERRMA